MTELATRNNRADVLFDYDGQEESATAPARVEIADEESRIRHVDGQLAFTAFVHLGIEDGHIDLGRE